MYRWSNKGLESIVPAKTFGKWLKALPNQNPKTIVEEASNPESPAHDLFEWDDSKAANEYRLVRARVLLGSFIIETEITTIKNKKKIIDVPFVTRSAPGKYEITSKAMKDIDKRDFILQEALAEFRRLRTRYSHLSELALVFAAMDEVEVLRKRK
jgi:hypothetical protein